MRPWRPNVTVATVVTRGDRYLLVEERDKHSGKRVFNQPAGHLEAGETLAAAALRETLEETRWEVRLLGVIGIGLYTAPGNATTYYRTTFLAEPLQERTDVALDPDILCCHWLDYGEIIDRSDRMRSPMVLRAVEKHRRGTCYPLDLIDGA